MVAIHWDHFYRRAARVVYFLLNKKITCVKYLLIMQYNIARQVAMKLRASSSVFPVKVKLYSVIF